MIFRTQSVALISAMTEFFRLWKHVEDRNLAPLLKGQPISYALYDGKFARSIAIPSRDCTSEELAGALSDYIKLFDELMKGYLTGKYTPQDVESRYYQLLEKETILI